MHSASRGPADPPEPGRVSLCRMMLNSVVASPGPCGTTPYLGGDWSRQRIDLGLGPGRMAIQHSAERRLGRSLGVLDRRCPSDPPVLLLVVDIYSLAPLIVLDWRDIYHTDPPVLLLMVDIYLLAPLVVLDWRYIYLADHSVLVVSASYSRDLPMALLLPRHLGRVCPSQLASGGVALRLRLKASGLVRRRKRHHHRGRAH